MANDRLTQLPVEVVVGPTSGKARLTQDAVEVVVGPTSAKARTTQVAVEVLYPRVQAVTSRLTQVIVVGQ